MSHLAALSPSALDLELRTISLEGEGAELRLAIRFFAAQLGCRRDFELTQAFLAAFLKAHADSLAALPALLPALRVLQDVQTASWKQLRDLLHTDLCLLSFLCRTQS